MNTLYEVFGVAVYAIFGITNTMIGCILFFIGIVIFLMFKTIQDSVDSVLIGSYLKKDFREINSKYKNTKLRNEAKIELANEYHYSMLASPLCSIGETFCGYIFALGCCSERMKNIGSVLFGLNLWDTPKKIIFENGPGTLAVVILLIVAVFVQFFHDNIAQEGLISDQSSIDYIILIIMFFVAFFSPSAFVVFWSLFDTIECIWLLLFKGPLKEARLKVIVANRNVRMSKTIKKK